MTTALTYGSLTLDWVTSYDESSEIHSEAFVLYDGTTKYAPVANAGRSLSFSGVQKNTSFIPAAIAEIGKVQSVVHPGGTNTSMTVTDFSYTFKAFDGTTKYYDWSLSFGQSV